MFGLGCIIIMTNLVSVLSFRGFSAERLFKIKIANRIVSAQDTLAVGKHFAYLEYCSLNFSSSSLEIRVDLLLGI